MPIRPESASRCARGILGNAATPLEVELAASLIVFAVDADEALAGLRTEPDTTSVMAAAQRLKGGA